MQEAADGDFVQLERFGKRRGFANEAAQALAEDIRHLAKVMDTATPDYRDQRSSAFSIRIVAVDYDNALTRYERFSVSE